MSGRFVHLSTISQDLKEHSDKIQIRLYSASNFILQHGFDDLQIPVELLMRNDVEFYLIEGESALREFLCARLMASNMMNLEDDIIRFHPNQDYDNLSDEALNTIIREHLRQKEMDALQKKDPIFPKGTGLSWQCVTRIFETRIYVYKPEISDSHNCSICMEDCEKDQGIAKLKNCEHVYHNKCIMKWLEDYRLCPLCKKLVLPIIAEYPDWVNDLDKVRAFLKRV